MEVGYARVSTQEQNLDLQLDALNKAGVKKIFTDKVSGAKSQKPQLEELLKYARKGDTIVVWRLDRLGRTTVQLIQFVEELQKLGISLKSLTEPIDTSTATGTLVVQIFCVLAEHERNVLRERTRAGLNSARIRGRTGGRPKGLSPKYEKIKDLVKNAYESKGSTTAEIMQAFKIPSRGTLYRILETAGVEVTSFVKRK
ncbi:resolvase [Emticicia aquatilis]|uniref:Resolvase n=1 Tax=Emticicia aquatilis TaxID=1537369 RepID=A0A916Z709_9BACT|nr:recombinase family protein [Emticicia aquatilis]GGD79438.1 resolvase [Emticicia aquatilis]